MGWHQDYGEDGPPVWYGPRTSLVYVNSMLAHFTGYTLVIRIRRDMHGQRYASQEVVKIQVK